MSDAATLIERFEVLAASLAECPNTGTRLAAGMYAAAGLKIFPCWWVIKRPPGAYSSPAPNGTLCACPRGLACKSPGKHPLTDNGHNEASSHLAQIARWWKRWPKANIGLPAALNGLAVLDVDVKEVDGKTGLDSLAILDAWADRTTGEVITATLTARTGSGGLHYIYRAPEKGAKTAAKTFGKKAVGLDTRGEGGYIIAPPSRGILGRYDFMAGMYHVGPWPQALTRAIDLAASQTPQFKSAPHEQHGAGRQEAWARTGLDRECEKVAQLEEGNRSIPLYKSAFKVGGAVGAGLLDAELAHQSLLRAAVSTGMDRYDANKQVVRGLKQGREKPRWPARATPLGAPAEPPVSSGGT